ncbi:MAG: hypothetical protein ACYC7E_20965 [Armatimonadota bacterium]
MKTPEDTPLLADLKDARNNVPYLDSAIEDIAHIAAKVDCRHNNGAIFAYVDGHVAWVSAQEVNQGSLFVPTIGEVKKPLNLGIIAEIHGDGSPDPNVYVGSGNGRVDVQPLLGVQGMTRLLGKTAVGRCELKTAKNALMKGFYSGLGYLPDWLDHRASVPEYGTTIEKNGLTHTICWGGHGDKQKPPDGNDGISPLIFLDYNNQGTYPPRGFTPLPDAKYGVTTKTWDITLAPAATVTKPLTKKIGIIGYYVGYGSYRPRGKARAIINSIKIGEQTYQMGTAIDLSINDIYLVNRAFLVPVKPKQNITFNITLAREVTVPGTGVYLAFED